MIIVGTTVAIAAALGKLRVRFIACFDVVAIVALLGDDFLDTPLSEYGGVVCDRKLLCLFVPRCFLDPLAFP